MNARTDALVVGGGPAGCAAAIGLARAGAAVRLIERERGPSPKVCGEFLSVEACAQARALGVDPALLGAVSIDRVRVTWRGTTAESKLPFEARSLSRAVFDEALIEAARCAGVCVERGVRALEVAGRRLRVRRDDVVDECEARTVVLATGKTELAGSVRRAAGARDALGFKMHLDMREAEHEALGTAVELTVFDGGYCGMQRLEGGAVAFAVVIDRAAFARYGSWRNLTAALRRADACLARRLDCASERWSKPLAVSGVPYGFVHRGEDDGAVYRVGDQFAVIPSFTGDGLAIALVTGSAAASAIARGQSATTFHAAMRRRLAQPMLVAGLLSRAIATPAGRAALVWPARIVPAIVSLAATATRITR